MSAKIISSALVAALIALVGCSSCKQVFGRRGFGRVRLWSVGAEGSVSGSGSGGR